ncbi:hypothetical protein H4R99_006862 [Coemansia sp. RSA 1722]|nr:hypothetical protein IWW45_005902 [Coemansia sp. RSA 485]KAJ2591140.1 hypothetical protein H4R99_006862 [Coemansia sp. RSA 1722]
MYSEIERLLSQIKSESGHGVVRSTTTPGSVTASQSQRSTEQKRRIFTGVQILDTAIRELDSDNASPPILELLGTPGSGKTQTLYRICANAALPSTIADEGVTVRLNGHGSHVLFVDVDGKSDVRLLYQYMRELVSAKMDHVVRQMGDKHMLNQVVGSALDRIHVFSPETTQSLVATLSMLPRYVAQRKINPTDCVLLVDGLGANYWFDKRSADNSWLRVKRATPMFRLQQLLVDTLQQAHRQMNCLCVVTNVLFLRNSSEPTLLAKSVSQESTMSMSQGSQGSHQPRQIQQRNIEADKTVYRDHMIPRWQNVVSRSFVLETELCHEGGRAAAVDSVPVTELRIVPVADGRSRQQPDRAYIGARGLQAAPAQSKQ